MAETARAKVNYGIDAPGLVRGFFIAGSVALIKADRYYADHSM
ncbi:MAG: hypothetical protein R3B84_20545 [Zavarzinella sp.]